MDPIIVAGAGPAAVHLLAELANASAAPPLSIALLDPRCPPEGGTPHSDPSPSLRVNMRNELHDIPLPGHPSFAEYLRAAGVAYDEPPPRYALGQYTASVARLACAKLRERGCSIVRVPERALSAQAEGGGYRVRYGSGTVFGARLVLATRNEPPSLPAGIPPGPHVSYYTGDGSFADGIGPSEQVGVIGTGPGAMDVARYLLEDRGHRSPIVLYSRQGLLSAVQTPRPVERRLQKTVGALVTELEERAGPVSLEALAAQFEPLLRREDASFRFSALLERSEPVAQLRRDLEEAAQGGPAWRMVLEAIGAFAPRLWRRMGPGEQERFMTNQLWLRLYYVKRHAMQSQTARWLLEQMERGRVRVSTSRPAGDRLVVATGPEYRVSRTTNPLVGQMVEARLAEAYRNGPDGFEIGGLRTRGFQLVGAPGVWAMGALLRGEDFAVHGYPSLARHAKAIVAQW